MKLGCFYLLWTRNWLRLMNEMTALREDRDRIREDFERLREQIGMSSQPLLNPLTRRAKDETFAEPPAPTPSKRAMMGVLDGWTTQYIVEGIPTGGTIPLHDAPSLREQLARIGGAKGKRVLELGPLEAAHTRILCEQGAREVVAVEGFRECWLRCLVAKEVFELDQARFLYGNFCAYAATYDGVPFDFVLAHGVLYHQKNPAGLIHDLGRLTDCVLVWSHVANEDNPPGPELQVEAQGRSYRGRQNDYQNARNTMRNYCGGVSSVATWLYPDELRRAFHDAGFAFIAEEPYLPTGYGRVMQLIASKKPLEK